MLPLSTAQSTVMSVKLSCTQSDLCYSTIIAHGRKNLPTTYLMSLWDPSMEQRLVNWLDASSSLLTKKYGQNIGLCRDDGWAAFNGTPWEIEKIRKGICKVFCDNDLKTTKVNFLDVTLDLKSWKYYPYTKEGNIPLYVHTKSNHPPTILKNIPK